MATSYMTMLDQVNKIPEFLDIETLDMYCEYLMNDKNKALNFTNLTNLYTYIDNIDSKLFMTNDAKMSRFLFIREYLDARLLHGLVKRDMVFKHIFNTIEPKYTKIIQASVIDSIAQDTLGKKDIMFINDMVFVALNNQYAHRYKAPLTRMLDDIETGDFGRTAGGCDDSIELLQSLLNNMTRAQRQSKQQNRFSLTDPTHFHAMLNEACDRLLSEGQRWETGWQGLNKMLDGGLENGRVYNFIGATGGFKSGLLLNIMKSIKLYNRGREHKDPTKRPTVLFISQENNVYETIARIFGIFGKPQHIKNFKKEEIIKLMADGGFRIVEDELDIDIEFRYAGNMEVGVNTIRGIIEELDNSGREVIGVIQDYIERLRPPNMKVERRIQLADVSNELHDMCQELDIWAVTGSQFNRNAVSTIEGMKASGKGDIGLQVGTQDVSESFGMLKNIDVNIGIVMEYDSADRRFYLSFRRLKFRGDTTNSIPYFLQPFVGHDSSIQLMDDINKESHVYRTSMGQELEASMIDDYLSLDNLTKTTSDVLEPFNDVFNEDIISFFDESKLTEPDDAKPVEYDRKAGLHKNAYGNFVLVRKAG